jgi:hypothetical protein
LPLCDVAMPLASRPLIAKAAPWPFESRRRTLHHSPVEILFREEQRFRQLWLWALLVVTLVPPTLLLGLGWMQQVVRGRPFGARPAPDLVLTLITLLIVVLTIATLWAMRAARLITEVRTDGLRVQFIPFHRHPRRIEGIRSFTVRDYSPIGEYGGWGLRWGGPKNLAYNVSGARGVQLELEDGRRILIGSQRPEELHAALSRVRSSR